MAVIAHVLLRNTSPQEYDDVRFKVGWLDVPPDGGIAHVTWWEGDDCHNIDAWESAAALNTFAESRLGPAMAALGLTNAPEITLHDAHEVFAPKAALLKAT